MYQARLQSPTVAREVQVVIAVVAIVTIHQGTAILTVTTTIMASNAKEKVAQPLGISSLEL